MYVEKSMPRALFEILRWVESVVHGQRLRAGALPDHGARLDFFDVAWKGRVDFNSFLSLSIQLEIHPMH